MQSDEPYVASKDVAWYAKNRNYVDQESWQHVVWDLNGGRYDDTYLGIPIRVIVLEVGEETLRWAYDGVLLRRRLSYTIGSNPAIAADHEEFIQILTPEGKRFGDFRIPAKSAARR